MEARSHRALIRLVRRDIPPWPSCDASPGTAIPGSPSTSLRPVTLSSAGKHADASRELLLPSASSRGPRPQPPARRARPASAARPAGPSTPASGQHWWGAGRRAPGGSGRIYARRWPGRCGAGLLRASKGRATPHRAEEAYCVAGEAGAVGPGRSRCAGAAPEEPSTSATPHGHQRSPGAQVCGAPLQDLGLRGGRLQAIDVDRELIISRDPSRTPPAPAHVARGLHHPRLEPRQVLRIQPSPGDALNLAVLCQSSPELPVKTAAESGNKAHAAAVAAKNPCGNHNADNLCAT